MAVLRYGEGLTDYGNPVEQIDLPSLTPSASSATLVTLTDKNGAVVSITGTGLAVGPGGISGGTVTAISLVAAGGVSLFSITGISTAAAPFAANLLATGGVDIALLDGNDRIFGSSSGDLLAGGTGNDRIFGGGGRDVLGAMDGRDQLTGGANADVFVFAPNTGQDRIMDFVDDNGRADDFIAVRPVFYDKMVMTQEGADVLLTFGKAGSLLILNQTVAEMGIDDFVKSGLPF